MWLLTIVGLISVTLAGAEFVGKRGYEPIDAVKLNNFTTQFRITLLHLIGNEWRETKPLVDQLNAESSACYSRIADMEPSCKSCAKDKCTPELHEVILKEAEKFLKKAVKEYVKLMGWEEVTKFFEGVGKKFTKWSGWEKMGDFFEDIGKGLVHWDGWKDIGDSLKDLGKGILGLGEDIGEGIKDFGEDVVDKVKDLGKDVEDGVKNLGKGIEDTVKDLSKGLEDGVKDLGKGIEDGVKDLGKGLEDTVKDIGKGLEDTVKDIGKGLEDTVKDTISNIFKPRISVPRISLPRIRFGRGWGKKKRRSISYYDDLSDDEEENVSPFRRDLDPETRDCMEQCASCDPFLVDEETRTRLVCGPELIQLRNNVQSVVSKIQLLYNRTLDDRNLVVSSVEYELSSFNIADLSFSNVQITVFFEGGYRTYRSKVPFKAAELPTTAALMAKEYYDQFMK